MDKMAPRDGKVIEELGYYHPIETDEKQVKLNCEKARIWLSKGATVTGTVHKIFNKSNITVK
jgi:small subunit ribosomal protein S16